MIRGHERRPTPAAAAETRRDRLRPVVRASVVAGVVSRADGLAELARRLGEWIDRVVGDAPETSCGSDFHGFDSVPDQRPGGHEWVARIVLPPH